MPWQRICEADALDPEQYDLLQLRIDLTNPRALLQQIQDQLDALSRLLAKTSEALRMSLRRYPNPKHPKEVWSSGNIIISVDTHQHGAAQGFVVAGSRGRLEQAPCWDKRVKRRRAFDSIFVERLWRTAKYEDIYIRDSPALTRGLETYFRFYNHERYHQSLDYAVPAAVYSAIGRHEPGTCYPTSFWLICGLDSEDPSSIFLVMSSEAE